MNRFARYLALVFAALAMGSCSRLFYVDCYGVEDRGSVAVHLVEFATATSGVYSTEQLDIYRPHYDITESCDGFDGVEPGNTLEFSNIMLLDRVRTDQCSILSADVA